MKYTTYLKHLDTVIAAIIGFYVIHLFTKYSGVGISPDSIMYASTATNIQAHWSLITFNETPLVFFPVFYPFFLGVIQFFSKVDPITAGATINSFLFAAVILTSGYILSRFVAHSRIYKWLILIAIILSPALLEIYSFLWSETLFILEIMLFILAYHHYIRKHSTQTLLFAASIAAISCITRYAGVTLIGAGGLLLLLDNKLDVPKKIKHICLFTLTAISLLIANLVYNRLTAGLSTGTREPSITPFSENLYYVGTVINDWGSMVENADKFAILITSAIMLIHMGVLAWKTYKGRINNFENIVIVYAFVYGAFIILISTFSRFERINSRLLSPLFIPLLISCTSWVPDIINAIKSKTKYALAGVAIFAMLAFEYATLRRDLGRYDDEMDYGVPGYSDDSWNKSEFIEYLKAHKHMFKPGIPIYTDANEAVYLFTDMQSALIPHKFFQKDVDKFYAKKHFYLIWFDGLYNKELVSLEDIKVHKNLVKVGEAKEGEIYLCEEK